MKNPNRRYASMEYMLKYAKQQPNDQNKYYKFDGKLNTITVSVMTITLVFRKRINKGYRNKIMS